MEFVNAEEKLEQSHTQKASRNFEKPVMPSY